MQDILLKVSNKSWTSTLIQIKHISVKPLKYIKLAAPDFYLEELRKFTGKYPVFCQIIPARTSLLTYISYVFMEN